MRTAISLVGKNEKVYKIKYTGEILYNVLMEEHNTMKVNNLVCETLSPENRIAQFYMSLLKLKPREQQKLIK